MFFKNQNKVGDQVITALFITSPNCKNGLGAISKCVVGKMDTTFPIIYQFIKAFPLSPFELMNNQLIVIIFGINPQLQLLSSEH